MSNTTQVLDTHRQRQAYVYIRQSTPRQVEEHLESQALQYQLVQQAERLGWSHERIVVLDEDLGKSGATSADRHGFQAMVAALGLGQVGIILVTDVSRLARNCADWYHLLDLASLGGTLISDAAGLYDPRQFDDRLLLGMKGTFAEAQWYTLRRQMAAARLNKAQRGELVMRLPVGYDHLADGRIVMTPDAQVQGVIRLVFAQFERLGSARAVLRDCREQHVQLPRQRRNDVTGEPEIVWVKPSYQAIYGMLKQPAYSGSYTYGKHHNTRLPGATRKVITRAATLDEWMVLKREAFAGYITWEQFMANQTRLRENAQGTAWLKGAPREGAALLQGLVLCGRCGCPMHVHYTHSPAYVCDTAHRQHADPRCQRFTIAHVDAAVVQVFLQALQPAHLETALQALAQLDSERRRLAALWEQRREGARYETELARRRYERVDPDQRLVAAELERDWEAKLQARQRLEREWSDVQSHELAPLSAGEMARIRALAQDVPALWQAETTTLEERKRLLRCLIQDVTVDAISEPGLSLIHVRWHTGAVTTLRVARPKCGGPPAPAALLVQVRDLSQRYPDDQVADHLNAAGVRTARDQPWTTLRVRHFRNKHHIPSGCPYVTSVTGPRGDGLVKVTEAAVRLDTTFSVIADWFRRGLLIGHQRQPGAPLWLRLMPDDERRWNGSAELQPDMLLLAEAPAALGLTPLQMAEYIRSGQLLTYRLSIHHRWRWYVQAPGDSSIHTSYT